jgi:hypothetical protein
MFDLPIQTLYFIMKIRILSMYTSTPAFTDASENPAKQREDSRISELEFAPIARLQLQKPSVSAVTFRELCKTAIDLGFTSRQKLRDLFGESLPKKPEKETEWPLPNAALCRKVLEFFTTLENATGNKLPWRHSQCVRLEAEQVLPNLPRTVMGHQQRTPV